MKTFSTSGYRQSQPDSKENVFAETKEERFSSSLFKYLRLFVLLGTVFVLPACGGEGGENNTPPKVSSTDPTSPADGATDVDIKSPITATFSEAMDASTITTETFTLSYNPSVSGTVSYDSGANTATFKPDSALLYNTIYTATITTGVTDAAGNALESDYSWSFTSVPVGKQNPTSEISSPVEGGNYDEGNTISFTGSGSDPEDGVLTGGSLVWTSSIDGQIGTGTSFSKDDLSVGTHTITLTATDGDGAMGTASVSITISLTSTGNGPTLQWTVQLGTSGDDYGLGIAVDSSGNAYATGYTWGDLDGNTSNGIIDIFITKYNTNGSRLWTVQPGTSGDDWGNGIAVDSSGNVYATGATWRGLDGNTNKGSEDIFITKYDTNGNRLWTVQPGTSSWEQGSGHSGRLKRQRICDRSYRWRP